MTEQADKNAYKSSSSFSKLFDKPETTLEDIINDEDFLSEVRIQNDTLFNYLSYAKIKEMIDLLL